MNWKRHTLVDISDEGREGILSELSGNDPVLRGKIAPVLMPEVAGARIPGITRREESAPRPGCVAIGFSSVLTNKGERLRLASFVNPDNVVRVTSPYELPEMPIPLRTRCTQALAAALHEAKILNLSIGVWGSAALELYTGLPYTHDESDLDLLVGTAPLETLSRFLDAIKGMEDRYSLRIDVELDLPNGFGVHLKELLGQTRTVIGKGLHEVKMFQREQLLASLPD